MADKLYVYAGATYVILLKMNAIFIYGCIVLHDWLPDNENFNPDKMYSENECSVRRSIINREMKSR
jgi:hypothetical protein